jgi:hypothetical protein
MKYRKLGKTDLKVSEIGLGTEHLNGQSRNTVISVIHRAIDYGINYFDVPFAFSDFRDNLYAGFKGRRDEIIICGHICCAMSKNGHYKLSRDVKENTKLFDDLLKRLHTDYIDIVTIQMVNELTSYENITQKGGIVELTYKIKKQGKARYIGVSGHKFPAVMRTINDAEIDVVMFPINVAWDMVPDRREIYKVCAKNKKGLVAMKIYGGGRVLSKNVTTVKCISYALSKEEVSCALPGVKNLREIDKTLEYLTASAKERNFKPIIKEAQEDLLGNCVYCNHCLPCPQAVDIGSVIRKVDWKLDRIIPKINYYYPGRLRLSRQNFKSLSKNASFCNECGACMKRCPFEVNVIAKMKQAVKLFGTW